MAEEIKVLDYDGLEYLTTKIDGLYQRKEAGKGLSTNDYTTTEKIKLQGIAEGAQVNLIEHVYLNGSPVVPSNKTVNIDLSSYALKSDIVGGVKWKGTVESQANLPNEGQQTGDMYHVNDTGGEYVWNGTAWEFVGQIVSLEDYYSKSEVDGKLALKANDASLSTVAKSGSYNDLIDKPVIPEGVTVDQALDGSSTNAIANKAVYDALALKLDAEDVIAITTGEIDAMFTA